MSISFYQSHLKPYRDLQNAISAVPPAEYGARFLRFMHHSLKHPEYIMSLTSSQEKKNT
jgi:hypothetical protein